MKLFELHRLSRGLAFRVVIAYLGSKFFSESLVTNQQELIAYFNFLINLDLYHIEDIGKYYKVRSKDYGFFLLRKPYSSDYTVYKQIFVDKEYQLLADLALSYCKNETINIIDGGANIGLTSIYLHQQLGKKKKLIIILVEPFPENVRSARLNFETQHMENFFFEETGLYNRNCFLQIEQDFRDAREWSVRIIESSENTGLKAVQITELLDKYGIDELDILKLDIEGAEKYLFSDLKYAAEFLKRTRIIAIEIHKEYIEEERILNILSANSFEMYQSGELHIGVKKAPKS